MPFGLNKKIIMLCNSVLIMTALFSSRVFADGFITVPNPAPGVRTSFPLEVKYHHVDVEINDQSSVTSIDQEFYNPTGSRLEGYYIFPIPEGAVIKKFTMFINGKEMEAELLEARKAREIYEDIVRKALDPALLEYQGRGLFKARIFPIEPYSVKRVRISYSQVLEKDNGTIEYIYPLNTEKFSSKPLNDVSINVNIKSADNLKNVYCVSHNPEIIYKSSHHAVISYEERNIKPDTDFRVYFNTDRSMVGISVLNFREEGREGFFFLSLSPGFVSEDSNIAEKDITFVLDVSGSMAGDKLNQAKKALLFCIENLNSGDRFQIIRFSTEAEALFPEPVKAEKANLRKAKEYINGLKPIGGTNIEEALSLALKPKGSESRTHMIIFITDGKPTVGETDEDRLIKYIVKDNKSNTRIFTFGIGYDINTHLLDKITRETKAYRYYVSPEEDLELKVSGFYSKVQSPVLTDVKIKFSNNIKISKTYPKDLPDMFKGSSLSVMGVYNGDGNTKIIIEGKINDKLRRFEYDAVFPAEETKNDFIPYLWAARHVGYLLDQVRLNGEDRELIDEITETSRRYGIITPYTSYLILEDERRRVSDGRLEDDEQTLGAMAPAASEFAKKSEKEFFGIKQKSGAGSVQPSMDFQRLNNAMNMKETVQGKSRLNFTDRSGSTKNLASQVKNIQGRAIYNSDGTWIDSRVQFKKRGRVERIKFAGKEYFDLLKKKPEAAQFYSLGKNVRFVLDEKVYEIYE